MLNGAGLKNQIRNGVWAECAMTVTYLSNIMTTKASDKCPYQVLFGCKPKINSCLKVLVRLELLQQSKTFKEN